MRAIFKELSRSATSKIQKEGVTTLKLQPTKELGLLHPRTHCIVPSQPTSSAASNIPKEHSSTLSSSQAKQELKPSADQAGKNQSNSQGNKDYTKTAFYGVAASVGSLALNELVKEYKDINQKLDELELNIAIQAHEKQVDLNGMDAFQVQPRLYLTTLLKDKDHQTQRQEQASIKQWQLQIQRTELQLTALDRRIMSCLSGKAPESKDWNPIRTKIATLQTRLRQEKEKQLLFEALHKVTWLHKTRQYAHATEHLQPLIEQLEQRQQEKHPTAFSLPYLLAVAYNTQAKLEACLVRTSIGPHDAQAHSDASLASYQKAIGVLEKEPGFETALAILKSSQGYLLNDRGDYAGALTLHEEANVLKPEDEHILCGIGQDLYDIEQAKLPTERNRSNLDMACGYVTRALQINDQVPNIYVTRGKIRVALGDLAGAMQDFESALTLDKNHSEAHLQKAQLLMRQSQCGSVMHFFKTGLVPLVDKPHAIKQQLAELKAVKENSGSKCALPEEDALFSSSDAALDGTDTELSSAASSLKK